MADLDKKGPEQPTIETFVKGGAKYSNRDPRQQQITDALVMFIAGDILPLKTVESESFKFLIEKLDPKYQLPSRKYLSSSLLQAKCVEVQNNVKAKLKQAENVCLTVDLWSNRQMRGYLGITGHFILDWTLKSVMVCCKRFKGSHSAENIRHEYEEVISCFEIAEKISTIVSDNASNMIKAFSLPGCEISKCGSVEIQGVSDEYETSDTDSEDDDENSDDENGQMQTESMYDSLPKHSRCYAHSLQLVVKDGLKEITGHLKSVLAKVAKIVNFVRKSLCASEILEDYKRLQTANVTRWNSQLFMIKSVLNVPEAKLNMIECDFKLTSYERKLLNELCTMFPI